MGLWTKYHKNGDVIKTGWLCDNCEGWNSRSTKYCPHCGELMKARVSVPTITTVDDFVEASDWTDWIDQTTQEVYKIYWRWCIKNDVNAVSKISFMKQVLERFPDLKSSPCKGTRYFRRR